MNMACIQHDKKLFIAQQYSLRNPWLFIFILHVSSKTANSLVYVDFYFLFYLVY